MPASNKKIQKTNGQAAPRGVQASKKCLERLGLSLPQGMKIVDLVEAMCDSWGDKAREKIDAIWKRSQAKKLVLIREEDVVTATKVVNCTDTQFKATELRALGQAALKRCRESGKFKYEFSRYLETLSAAARQTGHPAKVGKPVHRKRKELAKS